MRKLIVLVGLSRVRLGLVAAIAVVGLAFSGAAQAAPPDPVTLGATTLSNIRLNGVPGTQLVVAPGANVTITADWSDNNTGCPSCIDNLPVAFQGFGAQPAGCIEDHGFFGFSGTGTVDLGAAPLTPGTYNIVGNFEETFFCGQFWTVPNTFPVIAEVVVNEADDNDTEDENGDVEADDNDDRAEQDNDSGAEQDNDNGAEQDDEDRAEHHNDNRAEHHNDNRAEHHNHNRAEHHNHNRAEHDNTSGDGDD
jgi:hypothetical protein